MKLLENIVEFDIYDAGELTDLASLVFHIDFTPLQTLKPFEYHIPRTFFRGIASSIIAAEKQVWVTHTTLLSLSVLLHPIKTAAESGGAEGKGFTGSSSRSQPQQHLECRTAPPP